jgi:BMFP domain-containing protein YqiC
VQNRLNEVQSAILSPVDLMKRFLGKAVTPGAEADAQPEVEALRQRVAELEALLNKPARKRGKTPKRP